MSLTSVHRNRNWKLESDLPRAPDEKVKNYSCNLILQDKCFCMDRKLRKRQRRLERRMKNLQRLQELSQPRRQVTKTPLLKGPEAPLQKLLPRISKLSKPRFVTPKYEKPKEEEFCLPGKIEDWKAHNQWLVNRALPRRNFADLLENQRPQTPITQKITSEGMLRIYRLAKPKTRQRISRKLNWKPEVCRDQSDVKVVHEQNLTTKKSFSDLNLEHDEELETKFAVPISD